MILSAALIYSFVSLCTAQAASASDFNAACKDTTYTVETVEYKNGTQFLSSETCKNQARFHHLPCYRGPAPTDPNIKMDACPSTEPWTEQIIPFDDEGGKTIPGPFVKLIGKAPHGAGDRFRVRFNGDNPNFGVRGQKLLEALNKDVYEVGVATAHAHNWQEGPDGFSDIAEFDFDPEQGERSYSRDAVCRKVALVAESVSRLGGLTSKGVCYT
ncbi:MAG: hypothetical protein Q9221_001978 [Calogaya cf. arnoldii]